MHKNILLLGGYGFIGQNLLHQLGSDGRYQLAVLDTPSACQKYAPGFKAVRTYAGDFSREADLLAIFKDQPFDIVFHLVSTTIPARSDLDIQGDIRSNLLSTIKLLDLARQNKVSKIVFLSSGGTVYGISDRIPISEGAPKNPICSYGIVKLAIEDYLRMYNKLYGMDYLILRPSNPFGEHHHSNEQGLINVMLKKALRKQKIVIWGDGKIVRDYIYIQDLVKIIVQLLDKDIRNDVFNIGSGIGHEINEIARIIEKIAGPLQLSYQSGRECDVPKVVLDNRKIKAACQVTLTGLEEGILNTYRWTKENGAHE